MCRADVAPQATAALAAILVSMATALAKREGADPAAVRIGPVDFGDDEKAAPPQLGGGAASLRRVRR
jgi:hypothetical protein